VKHTYHVHRATDTHIIGPAELKANRDLPDEGSLAETDERLQNDALIVHAFLKEALTQGTRFRLLQLMLGDDDRRHRVVKGVQAP